MATAQKRCESKNRPRWLLRINILHFLVFQQLKSLFIWWNFLLLLSTRLHGCLHHNKNKGKKKKLPVKSHRVAPPHQHPSSTYWLLRTRKKFLSFGGIFPLRWTLLLFHYFCFAIRGFNLVVFTYVRARNLYDSKELLLVNPKTIYRDDSKTPLSSFPPFHRGISDPLSIPIHLRISFDSLPNSFHDAR